MCCDYIRICLCFRKCTLKYLEVLAYCACNFSVSSKFKNVKHSKYRNKNQTNRAEVRAQVGLGWASCRRGRHGAPRFANGKPRWSGRFLRPLGQKAAGRLPMQSCPPSEVGRRGACQGLRCAGGRGAVARGPGRKAHRLGAGVLDARLLGARALNGPSGLPAPQPSLRGRGAQSSRPGQG